MDIKNVDKNFDITFTPPEDLEWFSVREHPFSVHGITYSESEGLYRRVPQDVAEATSGGVMVLAKHTAGGRVRFSTDSPYIAVRVEEPFELPFSHMTIVAKYGVTIYGDKKFIKTIMPTYRQVVSGDPELNGTGKIIFDGIVQPHDAQGEYQAEVFLPLYTSLNSVYIGLKKDCVLNSAKPYKHQKPVVFYGSSITQGACACKSGDDYIGRLSRALDFDFVNLGFSGSARAEKAIAEHIASIDASVFVLDYDHNAPTVEYLNETHYYLYETVRSKNPNTPIILMTMPHFDDFKEKPINEARRDIIYGNFEKAKAQGDKNVYLVDCYGCFGEDATGECGTVDFLHPDSLGFLRMAERVYPVLEKILKG